MKIKTAQQKPFHLHIEHFFRKQYCLYAVLGLITIAVAKADAKMLEVAQHAYAQGYGLIGQYMREETSRTPISIDITARAPTISGQ
jgi:hypothetical protein